MGSSERDSHWRLRPLFPLLFLSVIAMILIWLWQGASDNSNPDSTVFRGGAALSQRGVTTELEPSRTRGSMIRDSLTGRCAKSGTGDRGPYDTLVAGYCTCHALLIGMSNYTAGWQPLPGVKKDIDAVEKVLRLRGFDVHIVRDPDLPTLKGSLDEFIDQYGREDPNNCLLFYFAGHGYRTLASDGSGDVNYLILPKSRRKLPNRQSEIDMTAVFDMDEIPLYSRRIMAKHVLFLMDSCYSGGMLESALIEHTNPHVRTRGTAPGDLPEIIKEKTTQITRQYITSSDAKEKSPDDSIFLQSLVAGLTGGADDDHDGFVTVAELQKFITQYVEKESKGKQNPRYGFYKNQKGDFVFPVEPQIPLNSPLPLSEIRIQMSKFISNSYIEGKVEGLLPEEYGDYKVLVYVLTNQWFIHPWAANREGEGYAKIERDGTWKIKTVQRDYQAYRIAFLVTKKSAYAPAVVKVESGDPDQVLITEIPSEAHEIVDPAPDGV